MTISVLLPRDVHRLKSNRYFTGAFILLEKLIHEICSEQQLRRSAPAPQRQEGGLRRSILGTPASGVHNEGLLPRKGFPSSPDCAQMFCL